MHLELTHEEGSCMNSRQRQMFLNTSLHPVCSGLHLKYYPYKNHRGQFPTVYRVGYIPASASQPGLKKNVKASKEKNYGYMQIDIHAHSPPVPSFFSYLFLKIATICRKTLSQTLAGSATRCRDAATALGVRRNRAESSTVFSAVIL